MRGDGMSERWASPRKILTTVCIGSVLLVLAQCASPIPMGADSKSNVLAGLSEVLVRSVAFSNTDSATGFIPSGSSVTVTVVLINPKNLAVSYTLSSNLPASSFSVAPPSTPVAASPTSLSFAFTLASPAEHRDVQFTLGKSVPATGKVFPSDTLSIHCDSPPNPVTNLIAGSDATTHNGFLAFTLPVAASDDDLSLLAMSFQDVSISPPGPSTSVTVGVNDATLLSVGSYAPDPLASVTSTAKRYFKPTLTAGHAYAFVLTLSDAAGQKAATQTVGGAGVQYTLSYNLNGGTGTVPSTKTYTYYDPATLPAAPTRTGYAFHGWNTAIDGSGTPITTNFNMTLGNITLYAQWTPLTVSLSSTALTLADQGNTATLTATVAPTYALDRTFTWSSSSPGVATVNSSGLVTTVAVGTSIITATATDGGATATCVVTVLAVPVTGISPVAATATMFALGSTLTLSTTSIPSGASNHAVLWSTSAAGVATVGSTTGLVTAVAPGTATITATTSDGGFTTSCVVTVTGQANPSVTFSLGTYQSLSFGSTNLSVTAGTNLVLTPSAGTLASSGTGWNWYVNGVSVGTTASYTFNTPTVGFYTVDVTVTYGGVLYSGSVNVGVNP